MQKDDIQDAEVIEIKKQPERTLKLVQDEYATTCATLGEKYYHSEMIKTEINVALAKIQDLNKEAFDLKKAASESLANEVAVSDGWTY